MQYDLDLSQTPISSTELIRTQDSPTLEFGKDIDRIELLIDRRKDLSLATTTGHTR